LAKDSSRQHRLLKGRGDHYETVNQEVVKGGGRRISKEKKKQGALGVDLIPGGYDSSKMSCTKKNAWRLLLCPKRTKTEVTRE